MNSSPPNRPRDVPAPDNGADAGGNLLQHEIAHLMPVGVVDALEEVHIKRLKEEGIMQEDGGFEREY